MNLAINVNDEDEQVVDQEHLEADADLALVAMEAKAGCKNAPISLSRMLNAPTAAWLAILSVSNARALFRDTERPRYAIADSDLTRSVHLSTKRKKENLIHSRAARPSSSTNHRRCAPRLLRSSLAPPPDNANSPSRLPIATPAGLTSFPPGRHHEPPQEAIPNLRRRRDSSSAMGTRRSAAAHSCESSHLAVRAPSPTQVPITCRKCSQIHEFRHLSQGATSTRMSGGFVRRLGL
ncbi:uncharacterized protein [Triticum aestivum]|uniref:uncharacterized protein n=1 Tax=Triticum aestivum TaxID=4565 RepID=UPI001D02AD43|nr:uncharacterized protein LOC123160356 [Triticum aestivum]